MLEDRRHRLLRPGALRDGRGRAAAGDIGKHRAAGPYTGGKYSVYEGGTRTPFITRWKGRIQPAVSDQMVCTIDLAASLAAGTGRFIFVSSSGVYSIDAPVPTTEDAPLQPFSALKGNEKTGQWLKGSPFLVVQAPGVVSLLPKDATWRDRIVLIAHYLVSSAPGLN